jgi:hypothetical protein
MKYLFFFVLALGALAISGGAILTSLQTERAEAEALRAQAVALAEQTRAQNELIRAQTELIRANAAGERAETALMFGGLLALAFLSFCVLVLVLVVIRATRQPAAGPVYLPRQEPGYQLEPGQSLIVWPGQPAELVEARDHVR